ncbi:MAG: PhnD/SsuA/transferrin family substrate-binding protein, partial [bacterium]|nr:PhnD/SsuA/transferrin family substrate-binding protein [bacterium]
EVTEDLASGGVDIARFRKLNRIVPGHIKRDLRQIRTGINNGTIPTMPVGGLANPVDLIISPMSPDLVAWQTLTNALHDMTGLAFTVGAPADWPSFVEMMCASPDTSIGTSATVAYIVANDECGVDAGLRAVRFGYDRYWSQFLVPRGSTLTDIADLDGRGWAYPDEMSMSGHVVPLGMMALADVAVASSAAAGSHPETVLAVYNGEADFGTTYFSPPSTPDDPWDEGDPPDIPDGLVASCAPTLDGLFCDGYRVNDARAGVVDEAPDIIQQVRILGISPAIPNDGLSFGAEVPANVRSEIEMALIEIADPGHPYHPAFADSLAALFGWQDVVLDHDADYEPLRALLDAIGFGIDDL